MLRTGLIGAGISRTQVHQLHHLLGELCGVAVRYELLDAAEATNFDLRAMLQQCEGDGYAGVNITHPFKLQAFTLVGDAAGLPAGLASVNTVRFERGRWRGDNTDYTGFVAAYHRHFGGRAPGPVLMLGAGGVGAAIAFALARLGVASLAIHDADAERAADLVHRLGRDGTDAHAVEGAGGLVQAASRVEGIINATPVGMHMYPGNPFPEDGLPGRRWAFDAVYTPCETEFVVAARRHGLSVIGGFELFLHQGIDAFELFSGSRVDREQAIAAYRARYPEAEADGRTSAAPAGNP